MFRKSLLVLAFSGLAFSAAQAADVVEPQPAFFDWTGPYIGAHVGYGVPSFDGTFDADEEDREDIAFADDIGADGVLFGLQLGYNWQTDSSIVFGIEGDASYTDFTGDTEDEDSENNDGIDAKLDWLASLRARLGFAADNFLFYATGGVAYAHSEFDFTDDGADAGDIDLNSWGWVAGAGVEWAFRDDMSLRVEGLYYGFDDKKKDLSSISDGDESDFIELENIGVVRAALNFRF